MGTTMRKLTLILLLVLNIHSVFAEFPHRQYKEGQTLVYRMRGINDGRHYEAVSHHLVKKKGDSYYEEVVWKSLNYEGKKIDLSPMKDFRQIVSLDSNFVNSMPDIASLDPRSIPFILGPILDLMTFYVDLNPRLFASKINELEKGTRLTIPYNKPSSWADGRRVILGEDCIDFRLTFQSSEKRKPLLRVEHIPPQSNLNLNLPEDWMRIPVSKLGPNNWVQIIKTSIPQTPYMVSYGYEYFDVHIYLDSGDGKIVFAEMYNPVEKMNRTAGDVTMADNRVVAVKNQSEPSPEHTFRSISLELLPTEEILE